jgi:CheY-like chemotaxis protein
MDVPKTVLVVDDDDELRETVCEILEDEGYKAARARNGAEGLDLLRGTLKPSLILLDLMMPIMNGWQFREAQLRDPRLQHIAVVVMTASRNLDDNPVEADEVLFKPLNLEALVATVQRYCGEPSQE